MAVFKYAWGTERPSAKEQRHLMNMTVRAEQRRAVLRAQYEAALAEVDRDVEREARELEIVRRSTPGGRYNREIAQIIAAQHASAKRGRGRPRKYLPGDPRPPRPSRARTPAGRLQAASMAFAKTARRPCDVPAPSAILSPVAAMPAIALDTAADAMCSTDPHQHRRTPAGTEALGVEAPPVAEPISEMEASASPEDELHDVATAVARQQTAMVDVLKEICRDANVSVDGAILLSSYVRGHMNQHHVARAWIRGQDGAATHDYDFTDAADESKVKPEVRAIFPGFGLPRQSPTMDPNNPDIGMSEEDLQRWMRAAIFNGVNCLAADFDRYMNDFRSANGFYKHFKRSFEQYIERERLRVQIWPFIERRLSYVELNNNLVARGRISMEAARCRVSEFDYGQMAQLRYETQKIYREIIDVMTWFDGFSRRELADWAGHDPDQSTPCRESMGFPGWIYPVRLHQAVKDGHMFEEPTNLAYLPPTLDELIGFGANNQAMRIASARLNSGADYADIEL